MTEWWHWLLLVVLGIPAFVIVGFATWAVGDSMIAFEKMRKEWEEKKDST